MWNQHKDLLSDEGTFLVYSQNIGRTHTVEPVDLKGGKKQYIRPVPRKQAFTGPAFYVSRGYGNSSYTFAWAYDDGREPRYAENHVNVIRPLTKEAEKHTQRIIESFSSEKTQEFISSFFGNGAISKTELETLFPIFHAGF